MSNQIRKTSVEIQRLSPTEAEVWIAVELDRVAPRTELRGKVTGPRCPGVSTVEVAYPLRALPRPATDLANTLTMRALIPEPNLWTEATPFVYDGRLELWHEGACTDRTTLVVGLKVSS